MRGDRRRAGRGGAAPADGIRPSVPPSSRRLRREGAIVQGRIVVGRYVRGRHVQVLHGVAVRGRGVNAAAQKTVPAFPVQEVMYLLQRAEVLVHLVGEGGSLPAQRLVGVELLVSRPRGDDAVVLQHGDEVGQVPLGGVLHPPLVRVGDYNHLYCHGMVDLIDWTMRGR